MHNREASDIHHPAIGRFDRQPWKMVAGVFIAIAIFCGSALAQGFDSHSPTKEYVFFGGRTFAVENESSPITVPNASFDQGSLAGWNTQQTSTEPDWNMSVTNDAESGSYAGIIQTTSGTSLPAGAGTVGIFQSQTVFTCQPGDVFYISYWVKTTTGGLAPGVNAYPSVFIDVTFSDGSVQRLFPTRYAPYALGTYVHAQGTFQIPLATNATPQSFRLNLFSEVDNYSSSAVAFSGSTYLKVEFDDLTLFKLLPFALQNSDFEFGNLTGWNIQETAAAPDWTMGMSGDAKSGLYAGIVQTLSGTSLAAGAGTVGILQNQTVFTCQPGDVYYVSYWAKPTSSGLPSGANAYPNLFIDVTFSDGSVQRIVPTAAASFSSGTYVQAQGSFQIPFATNITPQSFTVNLFAEIDNHSSANIAFDGNTQFQVEFDDLTVKKLASYTLQNAGFDFGNLTGWATQETSTVPDWTMGVTGDAESGLYAGVIQTIAGTSLGAGVGTLGAFRNGTTVACQSGQMYSLSYWAKVEGGGLPNGANAYPNAYIDVTYSDGSVQRIFPTRSTSFAYNAYVQAQGSFQIPYVANATAQTFTVNLFAEIDNYSSSNIIFGPDSWFYVAFDNVVLIRRS